MDVQDEGRDGAHGTGPVTCDECGEAQPERSRFCGRCGALVPASVRTAAARTSAADDAGPIVPGLLRRPVHDGEAATEEVAGSSVRPDRGHRRGALAAVVTLVLVAGAIGVIGRPDPEVVTAWTPRGGPAMNGVTSSVGVTDLSTELWQTDLEDAGSHHWWQASRAEIVGDVILVAGNGLHAIDARTLEPRWWLPVWVGTGASLSDPLVVLTGAEKLDVDVATGDIIDRAPLAEPGHGDRRALVPAVAAGLYLVEHRGGLMALRAEDLTVAWEVRPTDEHGWLQLASVDEDAIVLRGHEELVAVDPRTGRSTSSAVPLSGFRGLSGFLVVDGVMPIATEDGVVGLDVRTGTERWETDLGMRHQPFAERDGLLLALPEPTGWSSDDEFAVVAIDPATGEVRRRHRLPDWHPHSSPPTPIDGGLLVPRHQALDLVVDGTRAWTHPVEEGEPTPQVVDRRVLIEGPGGIEVLDLGSGEVEAIVPRLGSLDAWWGQLTVADGRVRTTGPGGERWLDLRDGRPVDPPDGRPTATTEVYSGHLVATPWGSVTVEGDALVAHSHEGGERWRVDIPTPHGTVLQAGRRHVLLSVGHEDRGHGPTRVELWLIDAIDGTVLDREDVDPGYWGAAVSDESSVYVERLQPDGTRTMVRVDASDAGALEVRWERKDAVGLPLLTDLGPVLVSPSGATVLDAATGHTVRTMALPWLSSGAPAASDGLLVVSDGGSRTTALDLRSGEVVWEQRVGAPIVSPPVIAGDAVYLVTADGMLHVMGLHDGERVAIRSLGVEGLQGAAVVAAHGMVIVSVGDRVTAYGAPEVLDRLPAPDPREDRVELPQG